MLAIMGALRQGMLAIMGACNTRGACSHTWCSRTWESNGTGVVALGSQMTLV